jgi:hypothetical protein
VSGQSGSHLSAEFWMYDTRLGRRWNVDPVDKPWESSYLVFDNNPVFWTDPFGADIDPSKLYEKEKGEYKHKSKIIAFEVFASTEKGQKFISDRAAAGFELHGVFVTDLNICIEKDGHLHEKGIDYTFDAENVKSDRYGEISNTVSNGRLQVGIHMDSDFLDSFVPNQLLGSVETMGHEVFYHGSDYEKLFLSGDYSLSKNNSLVLSRKWMSQYGIGENEYVSYNDHTFHAIPLSKTPWKYSESVPMLLQSQEIIRKNYHNWYQVHIKTFNPNGSMTSRIHSSLKNPLNTENH